MALADEIETGDCGDQQVESQADHRDYCGAEAEYRQQRRVAAAPAKADRRIDDRDQEKQQGD
jgi:hypothetical protein